MSDKPANKIPDYTLNAIKRYEQKTKRKQIVFNLEKPEELRIYESLQRDNEPASQLIKRLLGDYYSDTANTQ